MAAPPSTIAPVGYLSIRMRTDDQTTTAPVIMQTPTIAIENQSQLDGDVPRGTYPTDEITPASDSIITATLGNKMSKKSENKTSEIVPSVTTENGIQTHRFYLPSTLEKLKAGTIEAKDATPVSVTIVTDAIDHPAPPKGDRGQKRVTMADFAAHPAQKKIREYQALVDDSLIFQLIRPATIQGSEAHKLAGNTRHGQDMARPLPMLTKDGHVLRGHRRAAAIAWMIVNAPKLADAVYPKGTYLAQVLDYDHTSTAALKIFHDHTQEDERERPLIIGQFETIRDYVKTNGRADSIDIFGRSGVDDMARLQCLPDVIERLTDTAKRTGKNAMARNEITKLYSAAINHVAEQEADERRKAKAEELKAAGKSDSEITEAIEKIKPRKGNQLGELRDRIDADPSERGPVYADTWNQVTAETGTTTGRPMQRTELVKTKTAAAGHAATDNQWRIMAPLFDAIMDNKTDAAIEAAQNILDCLPVDMDAAKAATANTAKTREAKAKKAAAPKTAKNRAKATKRKTKKGAKK